MEAPKLISGADAIEVLCPISKVTGNRENPLDLLQRLDPDKARQLDAVLVEQPQIFDDSRLTDEERFDLIAPRLTLGTEAEKASWLNYLESISDVMSPAANAEVNAQQQKIEFDKQTDVIDKV